MVLSHYTIVLPTLLYSTTSFVGFPLGSVQVGSVLKHELNKPLTTYWSEEMSSHFQTSLGGVQKKKSTALFKTHQRERQQRTATAEKIFIGIEF